MLSRLNEWFNPATVREGRIGFRAPARVFSVAFLVRLAYMTLARTWRVRPFEDHFGFGYEAGRIARALVTGYGYADPFANAFAAHTGPTAWLPPLYPLLMAGVFRAFGVYSPGAAWVLLAINCVLSGLTAMAVWELGTRIAGRKVGLWAGWLWALYPAAMQYAVRWFWEMTLTTALFSWVLVLTLRMRAEPEVRTVRRWALFGLGWGLIALSNSTLLVFLPVCGVWLLMGSKVAIRRRVLGAGVAAAVCAGSLLPWIARNERVFHTFIPMRGNLGAEMMLGNGPGANGLLMEYNHPFQSPQQLALYKAMGEVNYVRMRGVEASATIEDDWGLFSINTLKRVDFFWFSVPHPYDEGWASEMVRVLQFGFGSVAGLLGLGMALRNRLPAAGLMAWAFVLLPIPYYVVTVHARFRHPLEPLICVFGVYLFQQAELRWRWS